MIQMALEFGSLTMSEPIVDSIRRRGSPGCLPVQKRDVSFRPSRRFLEALPPDFSLEFELIETASGHRRLAPLNGLGAFLPNAFLAGTALLAGAGEDVTVDGVEASDLWLIFQIARGMQEHFDREFQYSRDIFVRQTGREPIGPRNLLPSQMDWGRHIGEWPRNITEFRAMGRESLRNAGYDPTPELTNAFAFFELARKQPALFLADKKIRAVVRRALFDDVDAPVVDSATLRTIRRAAIAILGEHDRDNRGQFEARILGPHGSFLKQLVARAQKADANIDRPMVRSALLELGWQSCEYVGKCVDTVMTALEPKLYGVLDPHGLEVFRNVFCARPAFGHLPLALLAERLPFLQAAILHAWDDPHAADVAPTVQRLLLWYGDIARDRREADRRSKDPVSRPVALHLGGHEKLRRLDNVFADAADHVREQSRIACECEAPEWRYEISSQDEERITIRCACDNCDTTEHIAVLIHDFELVARQLAT